MKPTIEHSRSLAFANDRLRLSITNACNLTCSYCTNEGQSHSHNQFLPFDWIRSFHKQLTAQDIYIRKLNITGGEPTLHQRLDAIIAECASIADSVTLNTNGILITEGDVLRMHRLGLHNIKFGIDSIYHSSTKPTLRRYKVDTSRLLATVRASIAVMPRSSLNVVVSPFNSDTIRPLVEHLLEERIDKVELLELIPHDFRRIGVAPARDTTATLIVKNLRDLFVRVEYNPRLAKYMCWTESGALMQVAEDFCARRVCAHLWTRINAAGCFVPCIKGDDCYPLDLASPLLPQIARSNSLMCSGMTGRVVRASDGMLLKPGDIVRYEAVDVVALCSDGIQITGLDP